MVCEAHLRKIWSYRAKFCFSASLINSKFPPVRSPTILTLSHSHVFTLFFHSLSFIVLNLFWLWCSFHEPPSPYSSLLVIIEVVCVFPLFAFRCHDEISSELTSLCLNNKDLLHGQSICDRRIGTCSNSIVTSICGARSSNGLSLPEFRLPTPTTEFGCWVGVETYVYLHIWTNFILDHGFSHPTHPSSQVTPRVCIFSFVFQWNVSYLRNHYCWSVWINRTKKAIMRTFVPTN